jgi:hypothetical protein
VVLSIRSFREILYHSLHIQTSLSALSVVVQFGNEVIYEAVFEVKSFIDRLRLRRRSAKVVLFVAL